MTTEANDEYEKFLHDYSLQSSDLSDMIKKAWNAFDGDPSYLAAAIQQITQPSSHFEWVAVAERKVAVAERQVAVAERQARLIAEKQVADKNFELKNGAPLPVFDKRLPVSTAAFRTYPNVSPKDDYYNYFGTTPLEHQEVNVDIELDPRLKNAAVSKPSSFREEADLGVFMRNFLEELVKQLGFPDIELHNQQLVNTTVASSSDAAQAMMARPAPGRAPAAGRQKRAGEPLDEPNKRPRSSSKAQKSDLLVKNKGHPSGFMEFKMPEDLNCNAFLMRTPLQQIYQYLSFFYWTSVMRPAYGILTCWYTWVFLVLGTRDELRSAFAEFTSGADDIDPIPYSEIFSGTDKTFDVPTDRLFPDFDRNELRLRYFVVQYPNDRDHPDYQTTSVHLMNLLVKWFAALPRRSQSNAIPRSVLCKPMLSYVVNRGRGSFTYHSLPPTVKKLTSTPLKSVNWSNRIYILEFLGSGAGGKTHLVVVPQKGGIAHIMALKVFYSILDKSGVRKFIGGITKEDPDSQANCWKAQGLFAETNGQVLLMPFVLPLALSQIRQEFHDIDVLDLVSQAANQLVSRKMFHIDIRGANTGLYLKNGEPAIVLFDFRPGDREQHKLSLERMKDHTRNKKHS